MANNRLIRIAVGVVALLLLARVAIWALPMLISLAFNAVYLVVMLAVLGGIIYGAILLFKKTQQ